MSPKERRNSARARCAARGVTRSARSPGETFGFSFLLLGIGATLAEYASSSALQCSRLSGVPRIASSSAMGSRPLVPASGAYSPVSRSVVGREEEPDGQVEPRESARRSSAENCLMRFGVQAERSRPEKLGPDSLAPR